MYVTRGDNFKASKEKRERDEDEALDFYVLSHFYLKLFAFMWGGSRAEIYGHH